MSLFVHLELSVQFQIEPQIWPAFGGSIRCQKVQTRNSLDRDKVVKIKPAARELIQIHTLTAAVPVLDGTELLLLAARRQGAGTT